MFCDIVAWLSWIWIDKWSRHQQQHYSEFQIYIFEKAIATINRRIPRPIYYPVIHAFSYFFLPSSFVQLYFQLLILFRFQYWIRLIQQQNKRKSHLLKIEHKNRYSFSQELRILFWSLKWNKRNTFAGKGSENFCKDTFKKSREMHLSMGKTVICEWEKRARPK